VLYPVGAWGELIVINDYLKRYASLLSIFQIDVIRGVQALIVIGTCCQSIYLLQSRVKHMNEKPKSIIDNSKSK
jgi:hypothetical protein